MRAYNNTDARLGSSLCKTTWIVCIDVKM